MQLIRCTQKLLIAAGLKAADLYIEPPHSRYLGSWYANLLRIDRRKCIFFTNEPTLFNFLVPGVTKKDFTNLFKVFRENLEKHLAAEGIPDPIIEQVLSEYQHLQIVKTESKSVLGSMNDLAFHYKFHIMFEEGLGRCNLMKIIKRLNRMPMSALQESYPVEAMLKRLGVIQKREGRGD